MQQLPRDFSGGVGPLLASEKKVAVLLSRTLGDQFRLFICVDPLCRLLFQMAIVRIKVTPLLLSP